MIAVAKAWASWTMPSGVMRHRSTYSRGSPSDRSMRTPRTWPRGPKSSNASTDELHEVSDPPGSCLQLRLLLAECSSALSLSASRPPFPPYRTRSAGSPCLRTSRDLSFLLPEIHANMASLIAAALPSASRSAGAMVPPRRPASRLISSIGHRFIDSLVKGTPLHDESNSQQAASAGDPSRGAS